MIKTPIRVIIIIGMAISVKGIRYSYQVNLFNQVPTNVKSQVHQLPPVSEPEMTSIDSDTGLKEILPERSQDVIQDVSRSSPQPLSPRLMRIPEGEDSNFSPIANEPLNQVSKHYAVSKSPQTLTIENRKNQILTPPKQLSEPLAAPKVPDEPDPQNRPGQIAQLEPFLTQDNFLDRNLAYRPDQRSFLQTNGYNQTINNELQTFLPGEQNIVPKAPPPSAAAPIDTENYGAEPISKVSPIEIRPVEPTNMEKLAETSPAPNDFPADSMFKQAINIYQLIESNAGLLSGQRVDFYF